jgi:hypothetical protein
VPFLPHAASIRLPAAGDATAPSVATRKVEESQEIAVALPAAGAPAGTSRRKALTCGDEARSAERPESRRSPASRRKAPMILEKLKEPVAIDQGGRKLARCGPTQSPKKLVVVHIGHSP